MDSPASSVPVTNTTAQTESEPEVIEESPVFSFISNLSPIAPSKAATVTQGFSGLNSPPLVFRSPQLNAQRQTFAERDQSLGATFANVSEQKSSNNDESEKSWRHPITTVTVCTDKERNKLPPIDQVETSRKGFDRFVADALNIESVEPNISSDSTIKILGNTNHPPDAIANMNEILDHEHGVHSNVSEILIPGKTKQVEDIREEEDSAIVGRTVEAETKYIDSVSFDHFAETESELPINLDLDNEGQNSMTKQDLQLHGMSRRCLQFEETRLEVTSNKLAQTPSVNEHSKSRLLRSSEAKNKEIQADSIHPILCNSNVDYSVKIPKPQGIGLHLNSIVNTGRVGHGVTVNVKSSLRGNFNIRTKKFEYIINAHPGDDSDGSLVSSIAKNVSTSTDDNMRELHADNMRELHALERATYVDSVPNFVNKAPNSLDVVNVIEDQSTPGNKRKHDDQTEVELVDSQPCSKKKRNESSYSGDGCKRCNCKKSKCLKLYCDCFAAGLYCGESCTCQDCYNKPEHDDKVIGARQLIESRNPLAFAPRVVPHIVEQPASISADDGTLFTPSSARHKRGCNCKKSMCLKKYCECYQANVGCSDGCRCDGCKNVYGRKGENPYSAGKMAASRHSSYKLEHPNSHNLTPGTPAMQFVDQGNDASHELFQSVLNLEMTEDIMDLVASDQGLCFDNTQTANELSATGNLSDLRNPQDWSSYSKAQSSTGNSLLWHGSPNTPVAQHSRPEFLHVVDPDSELSGIIQDETPEILKGSPLPSNSVKVSSPNKKRVSPPHNPSMAGGLRTGRKFILKAVPSFPPLTPCGDSKNSTFVRTEDSEDRSGNK